MTRNEREELNRLSKECFGTSSRWQKIVNNGVAEPYENEVTKTLPDRQAGGLKTKTFKSVKSVVKRLSVEEVKTMMEGLITQREAIQKSLSKNETEESVKV